MILQSGHKISKKIEDINSTMMFKVGLTDMQHTSYLGNRNDDFF